MLTFQQTVVVPKYWLVSLYIIMPSLELTIDNSPIKETRKMPTFANLILILWPLFVTFTTVRCNARACMIARTGHSSHLFRHSISIKLIIYKSHGDIGWVSFLFHLYFNIVSSIIALDPISVELQWQLKWLYVNSLVVFTLDLRRDRARSCLLF